MAAALKLFLTILICAFVSNAECSVTITATVDIPDGSVLGSTNTTVSGLTTYYAFRGIPYAEPPTGDLRFAAPVANSNWTGTYNATYDRDQCVQGLSPVTGSEDCLYINVYVPSVSNSSNMSVMVWIHGGAFTSGNSSYEKFAPDYLLDEGVIFVSFNYRLGVFGFISTGDLNCPGNWGLKDQILALTWVKNNIAYFGGNSSNITIFGESAGAASVSYLLQTYQNKTEGLFQAAIMESGHSLCLWSLNVKAKKTAFTIGVGLGIITTSSATLVDKLRTISYDTLQTIAYTASYAIMFEDALMGLSFAPVIEPVHDAAVFVNNSWDYLSAGAFLRVPVMIGYNSLEASYVEDITLIMRLYLLLYDIAVVDVAPYDITSSTLVRYLVGTSVTLHYFAGSLIALSNNSIINYASVDQFNRPIREAVEIMSANTTAYFYVFGYEGECSGVTDRTYDGVGHTEELKYIFVSSYNCSDADVVTRSRMVRMWANFAKYGNPTPTEDTLLSNLTWPAVDSTSDDIDYFLINSTLSVSENPGQSDWEYYEELYKSYGAGSYTTY